MKNKTKELVLIELGRYMLDLSKLIFGGVILVGILQIQGISNNTLLLYGGFSVIVSSIIGFVFIKESQSKKRKE
jgi:hypothetical protein